MPFPRPLDAPRAAPEKAARRFSRFAAAALVLASALAGNRAAAQEERAGDGPQPTLAHRLEHPFGATVELTREDASERCVYDVVVDISGKKTPLETTFRLDPGQDAATVSLSVREKNDRTFSSLSLPPSPDGGEAALPELVLGLFKRPPAEIRLVRKDAAEPAVYAVELPPEHEKACILSTRGLSFDAGQTEAAFAVTLLHSRLEKLDLRVTKTDAPSDRLRLLLPVRRTALAAFENNFYVCFVKKIPFGTRTVTDPDGTTRVEQVYKGRWHYITNGLRNTLTVALCAVLLGAILGFLTAIVRYTHDKHGHFALLDAVCKVYITVIRGTPMTVQLLIAYFIIFSNLNNKVLVAILAFGFNSGAYVAEIIRAGIVSIDAGQMEAARSLGLSYAQGMRRVVLPQAIRNILPALGNEFIVMLKDTSIASFIGLDDLARGGSIIRSQTYQAYIPFLAVAAIYLVLVMIFSKLLARLERHLRRSAA